METTHLPAPELDVDGDVRCGGCDDVLTFRSDTKKWIDHRDESECGRNPLRVAVQPKEEQVVIENGEAIYDRFGRVRVNYRGKLGWCYLTHMEYDGDVA